MSQEYNRDALEQELSELREKLKGDFVSPKDMRRVEAITSLLLTDGDTDKLILKVGKHRESNRVTSFTRDRR